MYTDTIRNHFISSRHDDEESDDETQSTSSSYRASSTKSLIRHPGIISCLLRQRRAD